MKLLSFIAGVITGVVGLNLYGIFVKPTLPSEEDKLQGWDRHMADALNDDPYLADDPGDTQEVKVR